MFKFILLIVSIQFSTISYGQIFGWGDSGYTTGGGYFTNVDGNGTDVTITGFVNEGTTWGTGCMITGLDDQQLDSIQHSYNLVFSQPISLWFEISEINNGSTWNDTLIFSGAPIFSDTTFVEIDGSSVLPIGMEDGQVKITYTNVDTITILHGAGLYSNPGHIFICALHFDTTVSINHNEVWDQLILTYPIPADDRLFINNKTKVNIKIDLIDLNGRLINSSEVNSKEIQYFDVSKLASGFYALLISDGTGLNGYRKIIIE